MNESDSFSANDDGEQQQCSIGPIDIPAFWQIVLVIAYTTVAILSLIGNVAVLLLVLFCKELRSVTSIFISSISCASLLITCFSLWVSPYNYYQTTWHFGPMMCYVSFLVQGASLIWLPFTLTGIAVDRYLLVASPFRRQMSMKTCVLVIIGIWVGSFAVLGPYVSHVNYIEMFGCAFCIEDWKNEEGYRMLYGLCILLVRSALPLSIISICHWRIARILHQQNNKFKTMRSNSISSQSNEIRRRQRLQTLLLAMCLIFAFSSLPMDMFSVIQDWTMYKRSGNDGRTKHQSHPIPDYLMHFIFYFFHWLAMSGSILNPLVYAYFNENFRRHIQLCCVDFRNNGSFKHGFYTVITPNALQARLENTTPRNLLVPEETQQLKTTMEELQTLEVVEEHPEDVHV